MYLLQGQDDALMATFGDEADTLCAWENSQLAAWTFLRYCVIGLILLWRVWRIRHGAQGLSAPFTGRSPYSEYPELTQSMQNATYGMDLALAGCIFIQTEGVGLTIYFMVSAMMDNIAIQRSSAHPATGSSLPLFLTPPSPSPSLSPSPPLPPCPLPPSFFLPSCPLPFSRVHPSMQAMASCSESCSWPPQRTAQLGS
ncbi:unnamed protein product, partial [Prorocentrum cordatum]